MAIGRALLTAPELLLLDEPLASLDIPRKRELLPYLQRLAREINVPMLYVSHSLDEILHLADKVLVLEAGRVKAFGNLEEVWGSSVMHPWLPKEQQSSILKVSVLEHHPHYAMTALALGDQHLWVNKIDTPIQSTLRIRIQASDVSLVLQPPLQTSIRNILRAKVAQCFDDNGQWKCSWKWAAERCGRASARGPGMSWASSPPVALRANQERLHHRLITAGGYKYTARCCRWCYRQSPRQHALSPRHRHYPSPRPFRPLPAC